MHYNTLALISDATLTAIIVAAGATAVAFINGIMALLLLGLGKKINATGQKIEQTVTHFSVQIDGRLDELIQSKEGVARAEGKELRRTEEGEEVAAIVHERERVEDRERDKKL